MSSPRLLTRRRTPTPLIQFYRAKSSTTVERSVNDVDVLQFDEMPGPKGLPFIGSFHQYITAGGFKNLHEVNRKYFKQYGPVFKETLFGRTMVHVIDPDDTAKVYRAEGKYPLREGLKSFAKVSNENGVHSMTARNGLEWKRLRKPIQSKMMRPKELYNNIESWNLVVDDALDMIRRERGLGTTQGVLPNLQDELSKWSMESIGVLVFDERLGILEENPGQDAIDSIQAIKAMFAAMHNLEIGLEVMFYQKYETPSLKRFRHNIQFARNFARKIVEKRMNDLKDDLNDPDKLLQSDAVPLISYLLAKREISVEEIADGCVDMFIGGVDTTSLILVWGLYRLATNQDAQDCLRKEIESVVGKDGQLTANDMGKIPYTKACIKEISRLDGVAFANSRILEQDLVLSGYNIPAGVPILPNIYATARSEAYFKDAEAFKPERWLRESSEEINAFSSLPFGFGPRMCIGKRAAELEVILFLSKVVQRFHLEYVGEKPLGKELSLLLQPDDKHVKINFVDRY